MQPPPLGQEIDPSEQEVSQAHKFQYSTYVNLSSALEWFIVQAGNPLK